MSRMNLRTYTVKQLEKIAAQQVLQLKEHQNFTIPVDIEAIVEKFHGIIIDVQRGLKEHHSIWGMVGPDLNSDKILIIVDDQLLDQDYLYRIYRMTVAEELAHAILHREAIKEVKTVEDFKALHNHSDWDRHDRNAKRLAAALLIPAEHVSKDSRELYTKMVRIVGYGNPDAIKKHLANKLAEQYEVSVKPMKFRLGEWPIRVMQKIDQAMSEELDFLD